MPQVKNTYGDKALDEELDRLHNAIQAIKGGATKTVVQQVVPGGQFAAVIEVKDTAGAFDNTQETGLQFDSAAFTLSQNGTLAKVQLVAQTVVIPVVTSDPGTPATGELWYRSDTNMLSIWTGAATKRVGMT